MINEAKLNDFIGKMLGDLGGAFSVRMVRIGDRLGLYAALKDVGMGHIVLTGLVLRTLIALFVSNGDRAGGQASDIIDWRTPCVFSR